MEAAVLNPLMMADVNCNNKVMNAELEVIKLQELVRKLERQNEQLRTRANAANNCTSSPHIFQSSACLLGGPAGSATSHIFTGNYCISPTVSCTQAFGPYSTSDEHFAYFHPQSVNDAELNGTEPTLLDEVETLDLDAILPIDGVSEDSWLYVSPKARVWMEFALSPLQWCRQVLDNPRPEVELAKRSLCHRLEQAKRWRGVYSGPLSSPLPYSSVDGLSSLSSSIKSYTKPALIEQTAPYPPSSHLLHHQTLSGKGCFGLTERSPTFLYHSTTHSYGRRHPPISPQSSMDSELSVSELEDDSISMGYKLQDMTDVQVMARLQEESLRQEYATTSATAGRRCSSFSFHSGLRGAGGGEPDLEEEDEEYDQLPPAQPRLLRAGSSAPRGLSHSQTFSSLRECRRSPSAPQHLNALSYQHSSSYAPETPSYRPGAGQHTDKLRRSMPNLIRAPSMPCVPSVPSVAGPGSHIGPLSALRNSQSFDSSNGLARLQSAIPSPGQLQQRVQSVGNFSMPTRQPLKATAYVSPTIQGPATMPTSVSLHSISSSGIPLPNKPSTPPSANRSALPRPASVIGTGVTPRSKIAQAARSLLTPPKSVSALSALRDGSWKDGCY